MTAELTVKRVTEDDLTDLLALVRSYCDFYEVAPADDSLLAISRALIADPVSEGVQLIARLGDGSAVGFSTVYWSWDTTIGGRIGILHDLFVSEAARGTGAAQALMEAIFEEGRARGVLEIGWQTALDNHRAQAVYAKTGAATSNWLDYRLVL